LTLAVHEIADEDVRDLNLEERAPEKYRLLWKSPPPPILPWAWEAVNDPQRAPAIAATMMRLNGSKVTTKTLARALGVSVATLYRRYGQREICRVCQEQPLRVLASVGKKKPIRARSELD
jgi:ABC-type phosphate/phosphonate transport system substrate-binding protein